MLNSSSPARYAAVALVALALAGCNKDRRRTCRAGRPRAGAAAPVEPAAPVVATELSRSRHPAGRHQHEPGLVGAHHLPGRGATCCCSRVEVSNNGKTSLVSAGKKPVRLAITHGRPGRRRQGAGQARLHAPRCFR
jgi:hypothetical protein